MGIVELEMNEFGCALHRRMQQCVLSSQFDGLQAALPFPGAHITFELFRLQLDKLFEQISSASSVPTDWQ